MKKHEYMAKKYHRITLDVDRIKWESLSIERKKEILTELRNLSKSLVSK
ncbi:MAG: hypothetical protein LBC82_07900 [Oscillospiraceae bacterium]|jgi:hypothetical protein|nr:hypothetical protein [Oscillospiraceae bacterium]